MNFFQFAYLLSGEGTYSINQNKIAFKPGDMFLITPNDCHEFDLECESEFVLIKFDQKYMREYYWKSIDHIECLLFYSSHLLGSIIQNEKDQNIVASLICALLQASEGDNLYDEDLMRHLINSIIVIAARNISKIKPKKLEQNADQKLLEIIDYIQNNIHCPSMIKTAAMAKYFGISETYLGTYFKKHCGETLQDYISSYKIRLIEHRLKFSDSRINEIVDEFGFTDESHINRFFKKQTGMSMTNYRKATKLI